MHYFIIIKEHVCQIYATSSRPSPVRAVAARGCGDNRGFWCDFTGRALYGDRPKPAETELPCRNRLKYNVIT